jgi:hypothetical protein
MMTSRAKKSIRHQVRGSKKITDFFQQFDVESVRGLIARSHRGLQIGFTCRKIGAIFVVFTSKTPKRYFASTSPAYDSYAIPSVAFFGLRLPKR